MNNDNKVETAMAGLNCWASYAKLFAHSSTPQASIQPSLRLTA